MAGTKLLRWAVDGFWIGLAALTVLTWLASTKSLVLLVLLTESSTIRLFFSVEFRNSHADLCCSLGLPVLLAFC